MRLGIVRRIGKLKHVTEKLFCKQCFHYMASGLHYNVDGANLQHVPVNQRINRKMSSSLNRDHDMLVLCFFFSYHLTSME